MMRKVLLFTGKNCAGCDVMKARFEELKQYYSPDVFFDNYDVEHDSGLAMHYNVMSIPALVFIKDDEVVDMTIGVVPIKSLMRLIEEELL